MSAALSYSSGESAAPLLGDTARSWLDAQVIGVPDAKYGEEVTVWVRLAHYKIPRYVHIVDESPMTVR
jgi:acyl-CoA synthetase (AMP-forming)/AMP-acid ligase II